MSLLANSPFSSKINSFFSPTEQDLRQIRATLTEPRARLVQLDEDIAETEATLAALKSQRAALQLELAPHESLLAPIRRVPQYILEEIFFACLPTVHNAVIDAAEAPLLLRRVNRHWRQVAEATPLLWSSLHICGLKDSEAYHRPYPDPRARQPNFQVNTMSGVPPNQSALRDLIEQYLNWSAGSPLSLSYVERPDHWRTFPSDNLKRQNASWEIFEAALKHHDRIKRLDIWAPLWLMNEAVKLAPQEAPALRHVRLIVSSGNGMFHGPNSGLSEDVLLESADSILRKADLTSVFICSQTRPLELPLIWENLTHLGLVCEPNYASISSHIAHVAPAGGLDQNTVYAIFQRCPNLAHCELAITVRKELDPAAAAVLLTMASLEHLCLAYLHVNDAPEVDVAHLLRNVSMPKLRLLRLARSVDFVNLQNISDEKLNYGPEELAVSIDPSQIGIRFILDILQELPRTTHLFLIPQEDPNWHTHRNWLTMVGREDPTLFPALTGDVLCPLLVCVQINLPVGWMNFRDAGLTAFLRSRSTGPERCLRALTLDFAGDQKIDVDEELREIAKAQDSGFELNLVYTQTPPPNKWIYDPRRGL
ncbi:Hexose carrier protein [Mycena indigotica]|uniref:Hexose carrier protein n=1 Tax=Mycena indigotica TaxID=2126181 RepID=A0A8H6SFL0_9AGAR|nr:Hexose carrier protein [Mycena indigotica]KAF7298685.1 Hexose carrier protein [Mycena indigotica]